MCKNAAKTAYVAPKAATAKCMATKAATTEAVNTKPTAAKPVASFGQRSNGLHLLALPALFRSERMSLVTPAESAKRLVGVYRVDLGQSRSNNTRIERSRQHQCKPAEPVRRVS